MVFHVIVIILGPLQIKIICSACVGTWYCFMCHQVMIFFQLGTYKLAKENFCLIMLDLALIFN
jgi:hypothetical protein